MHQLFIVTLLLLTIDQVQVQCQLSDKIDIDPEYINVSYGSLIKLSHSPSNAKLHSHKIPYGSGSGQQSVTGLPKPDDPHSYWLVEAQLNHIVKRGEPVPCNAIIRFLHPSTSTYLHSHLHKSPISKNMEVSAFPAAQSNSDDHWQVYCTSNEHWQREVPVYIKHVSTNTYLYASSKYTYSQPIPGQLEVSAVTSKSKTLCEWIAKEGIYYKL